MLTKRLSLVRTWFSNFLTVVTGEIKRKNTKNEGLGGYECLVWRFLVVLSANAVFIYRVNSDLCRTYSNNLCHVFSCFCAPSYRYLLL